MRRRKKIPKKKKKEAKKPLVDNSGLESKLIKSTEIMSSDGSIRETIHPTPPSIPAIDDVKTTWTEEKKFIVDVPGVRETDLPMVSVLTITRNRPHFFPLPIYNWKRFKYPPNKMEWVIIDDSDTPGLEEILPKDSRIKYFYLQSVLPIADKRNYGVKKCTGTHIVHMDDDDFYFDDSVLAKMRIFLHHPEKGCIISLPIGIYSIHNNSSAIVDSAGTDIPEASMAYTKKFWKEQKFGYSPDDEKISEWYGFCNGRRDKLINMPFWFNLIALTHLQNSTPRFIGNVQGCANFYSKLFDKEMKDIVNKLEEDVRKKSKKEKVDKILEIKKHLKK